MMLLMVTPAERSMFVLPLPALLNVAVSLMPGTGDAVQSLTFDQTGGGANANQWIAFNKVNDPSGVPSQILGSLDAIGQIYIINANGIIFGGS